MAGGAWQAVGPVSPDSTGAFTVDVEPQGPTSYRLASGTAHAPAIEVRPRGLVSADGRNRRHHGRGLESRRRCPALPRPEGREGLDHGCDGDCGGGRKLRLPTAARSGHVPCAVHARSRTASGRIVRALHRHLTKAAHRLHCRRASGAVDRARRRLGGRCPSRWAAGAAGTAPGRGRPRPRPRVDRARRPAPRAGRRLRTSTSRSSAVRSSSTTPSPTRSSSGT